MSMLTLFHLGGQWLALDGSRLVPMPEYPELDLPTVVISDFNNALTGVMSLEANASMAAPLIERRLRDEGMIEGETRLEVSSLVKVGKGFQALYSAVPMDDWQSIVSWANARGDHCVVVPLLSVIKRLLRPGQAVVVRHGKQLTYLSVERDAIHHAETLAYSDDSEGVRDSIKALSDRVRALLGKGRQPDRVDWYALDAAPGQDDNAFAAMFGEALGLDVELAAHASLTLPDGRSVVSAMPAVADAAQIGDVASSKFAGFMVRAEQALPVAAAAAMVLAIALLLIGWHMHGRAEADASDAGRMQAQVAQITAAARSQRAAMQATDSQLADTRTFIERMADASQAPDISRALARVRQAAQTWVRILRMRIGRDDHRLYVEGAVDKGADGAHRLGMFIANLRAAGYEPVAVDPPLGTRSAGYFAYALDPATTTDSENAP